MSRSAANSTAVGTIGGKLDELLASADGHNSIYRGKDLTNVYSINEIHNCIANGSFEDLYIGDYFKTNVSNMTADFIIAGFNYYANANVHGPHAVIVPRGKIWSDKLVFDSDFTAASQTAAKNASNSTYRATYNGYLSSSMITQMQSIALYARTKLTLAPIIETSSTQYIVVAATGTLQFTSNVAITGAGSASDYPYATLMTREQLYGYNPEESFLGASHRQLPLFRYVPPERDFMDIWLKNAVLKPFHVNQTTYINTPQYMCMPSEGAYDVPIYSPPNAQHYLCPLMVMI